MRKHYERPDYELLICCPICGGESGYKFKYTARITTYVAWDGVIEDSSESTDVYSNKARCIDCGKVVENYIKPIQPAESIDD